MLRIKLRHWPGWLPSLTAHDANHANIRSQAISYLIMLSCVIGVAPTSLFSTRPLNYFYWSICFTTWQKWIHHMPVWPKEDSKLWKPQLMYGFKYLLWGEGDILFLYRYLSVCVSVCLSVQPFLWTNSRKKRQLSQFWNFVQIYSWHMKMITWGNIFQSIE